MLEQAPDFPGNWRARRDSNSRPTGSLARAQIQLKEFDKARATIDRVHAWLQGDFRRYFDTDPLEAFADFDAKYYQLSAELATAEVRKACAAQLSDNAVFRPQQDLHQNCVF